MRTDVALLLMAVAATASSYAAPSKSDAPFSYYSATQMRQLASAYVSTHGQPNSADPVGLNKAAEFRGYILAKAESWNKDWRGQCDGPAGQQVEAADTLALQIATIVANTPADKIAEAGESNVDLLIGWGVFSRCMPADWK